MLLIPAFVDPANGNLVQDGVLGRGRHFCRCRAVRSMDAFAVRYLLNGSFYVVCLHSYPSATLLVCCHHRLLVEGWLRLPLRC